MISGLSIVSTVNVYVWFKKGHWHGLHAHIRFFALHVDFCLFPIVEENESIVV